MNDITDKMKYFGGVEGGATHSNLVICDENFRVIGRSKGPGTNHWIMGIDECADRILKMLDAAKDDAAIPRDMPLYSLGLTLSGCEQDSSNAELAKVVKQKNENSARSINVASDTAGSLFTGAPGGGMVLIAGTGSNALLRTPDGQQYGCGAYWIALRAIKAVFDETDGLRLAPHPTQRVWEAVKEYFLIETRADVLPMMTHSTVGNPSRIW
ncbi:unnamed protein product [Leptidea sinapis]|uniref:N-acetyl-D-glucosamine kinase n=1 Tax=Leptidea sinapis TaxID=189913 RepID=A0A5E4PVK3_9NEOP|nr:unnamed protein product [Leptidea sinapis]